jgi:arylsulfatase A-like enzyme
MKKPNVILISIDTLRADHLSCYGYSRETTPNIDRLAEDGTIFLKNYSTGVWTPPGHASMLTGLYIHEHGVYDDRRLSKDIPTIATILKENGYHTAGFVNNSQVGELVGFEKGHDVFEEVWRGISPRSIAERLIKGIYRKVKASLDLEDMGAKKTCILFNKWLESLELPKNSFYAFLHFIEPHNPLSPPRGFKKKFLGEESHDGIRMEKIKKIADNPLICYIEDLDPGDKEIQYIKDLYDGEISYIDSRIGWLVNLLKEKGCYDNTLIIITSDHGEHFGEYGMWSHVASLYKEVLHVPLIIKFPAGTEIVKEVTQHTQLIDIFPTVMEITGVSNDINKYVSGVSLLNNGGIEQYHQYVFAEWEGRIPFFILNKLENNRSNNVVIDRLKMKMTMVQDERFKYILKEDGSEEIYDISRGKDESINDLTYKKEIRNRMQAVLLDFNSKRRDVIPELRHEPDEKIAENLRSLGYM